MADTDKKNSSARFDEKLVSDKIKTTQKYAASWIWGFEFSWGVVYLVVGRLGKQMKVDYCWWG